MIQTRLWSCRNILSQSRLPIGIALGILCFGLLLGCNSKSKPQNETVTLAPNSIELVFTYGSEKEKWITEVTESFNRERHRTSGGKPIFVRAIPMGSGEAIDEVMEGRRRPHIISPA